MPAAFTSLWAEDFAEPGTSRREVGNFATREEALAEAVKRVDADLRELSKPRQAAKALFDLWVIYGRDFYLVPDDRRAPFSAMDFTRLHVATITGDESRPLTLEVTCRDRLNTASGGASAPSQWSFWVQAPATYAGAVAPMRRAVEEEYRVMSAQASASDGSRYTLLEMSTQELPPRDAALGLVKNPRQLVYTVQADGRLKRTN